MSQFILSKSSLLRSFQCQKALYLYKNHYDLKDDLNDYSKHILDRGKRVGKLARLLFPGGVDCSPSSPIFATESVKKTKKQIEAGKETIYEAGFLADNILIMVDILQKNGNGWDLLEVKSAARISKRSLMDAAIQYYVVKKAGLPINDVQIINVNSYYKRDGDIEVHKLFKKQSVLKDVEELMPIIKEKIYSALETLQIKRLPKVKIGQHCLRPFKCDFYSFCWGGREESSNSLLSLSNMKRDTKFELFNNGVTQVKDIPEEYSFNENINLHIECVKENKIHIDHEKLSGFIDQIKYPIAFVDFECLNSPIPLFNETKPFQFIPFQYSLHLKESEDTPLKHMNFIAEPNEDPRSEFLNHFLNDTARVNKIVAFDRNTETRMLKSLAHEFPHKSDEINKRLAQIVDLQTPFKSRFYYNPSMNGSFSLKNVLPALIPDLNYETLDINSGELASISYEKLFETYNPQEAEEIKDQLNKYCEMDTLALWKIFEVLSKEIAQV